MSNTSFVSVDDLSASRIAEGMSSQQVEVLTRLATVGAFEDGQAIMEDEDESDSLFVLIEGRAQVQGAFDQEVNVVEKGTVLGELSFLDRKSRSATVRSIGSSKCAILSNDCLKRLETEHPDVLAKLLLNLSLGLCQKLRSAMRMVNALSTHF